MSTTTPASSLPHSSSSDSAAAPTNTASAASHQTASISSFSSSSSLPPSIPAFPHAGLLPKQETQADTFLSSHPTCDGRGVLVAIFDTGTDVAAPGLRCTSDGKPKVVEAVDCSGSGDVDVSVKVMASAQQGEQEVETLMGRKVRGLRAKDGEYWMGIKRAYELFPEPLVARMRKVRRRRWDEAQRRLEAALHRQVNEQAEGSRERTDCELRYNEVKAIAKQYDDPGPVLDILCFRNEEDEWAATVVSQDNEGNVIVGKTLRDYHLHHEYDTFSGDDLCHFTVNLDSSNRRCQLVVPAGAHGTHVSGIVAAHFPDQPELNGQAPGAQLVSVKIGDSRLGSMETGVGLMRGLIVALRWKVDLINMSYGEAAAQCDVGRFPEGVRELVNKYGVLFVCSAGNAGPALTTAGSPGATTSDVIGVGAYVSPAMMVADYSLRRQLEATQYTWSSRGPSADGALGVSISAPGGAITSVPTWTLQGLQLMHGTSMSSPSAASALCLLLSACKQHNIAYSPHRIRRAIENTANPIPSLDPLTAGCGLLQVEAAWNWLQQYGAYSDMDVAFRVSVGMGRGVYLREREETSRSQDLTVTIEPSFFEKEEDRPDEATTAAATTAKAKKTEEERQEVGQTTVKSDGRETAEDGPVPALSFQRNQSKVNFQLRVALMNPCPAYLDCPSHLMLMHGGRSFSISVHPQRLSPGLYHSSILGLDSTAPDRGPLFRVPVTIIVPERPQGGTELMAPLVLGGGSAADGIEAELVPSFPTPIASFSTSPHMPFIPPSSSLPSATAPSPGIHYFFPSLPFTAGTIHRKFVLIPDGATWVDLTLTGHGIDTSRQFMFHCIFLLPDTPYRDLELNKYFSLQNEEEVKYSLDVVGGRTLELCLAQYWNVDGDSAVDLDVSFHGIKCDGGEEAMQWDGSDGVHRVDLMTALRPEALNPVVTMKFAQQPIRPSSSHLSALSSLDVLPGNRQVYQLLLSYHWECKEDSVKVVCRLPLLQGVLYESVYESQLHMWFDANKRLEGTGDAWPKEITVRRGRHTIRVQVRHDDVAMLDRLRDMVAVVEVALSKPIELSVYASFNAALQAGTKWGDKRVMKAGGRRGMWIVYPEAKAIPSWCKVGDVLLGTMVLGKGEKGGGKSGALEVRITVPPAVNVEKKEAGAGGEGGPGKKAEGKAKEAKKDDVKKEPQEEEKKVKVEEAAVEDKVEPDTKPIERFDVDNKKLLETVRPVITEEQKEAIQHEKDKDGIQVTIGDFEKKEGGEEGSAAEAGEGKDGKDVVTGKEIEEEIRDLQVDYIAGLKGKKKQIAFDQIFPPLFSKYPHHLPLLLLKAETLFDAFVSSTPAYSSSSPAHAAPPPLADFGPGRKPSTVSPPSTSSSSSSPSLRSVLESCDAVLSELDQTDIAAHFGRIVDRDDPSLVSARHRYEDQRDAIVTALTTKLQALLHVGVGKEGREGGEGKARAEDYERVYTELASWVDVGGKGERKKFSALTAVWNEVKGRWGAALRQLNATIADGAAGEVGRDVYEERLQTLKGMVGKENEDLVLHWVRYEEAWNAIRFPRDFTLF